MQPDDDKTRAVAVLSKGKVVGHYRMVKKIGVGDIRPFGPLLPTPAVRDNSGSPSD
jgi:hypothetical protein